MATLSKTLNPAKFQKAISKSIKGISTGFKDPKIWISTGNYTLNKKISGNFSKGFPLGKISIMAGSSGCLPEDARVNIYLEKGKEQSVENVDIKTLKSYYDENYYKIQILTPDGYQPIGQWFDKGELEMVKIYTQNHYTRCAYNHLIQLSGGEWRLAYELEVDDRVITKNGLEDIVRIDKNLPKEHCYDFEILHENHRYWGDGFSSHNSGKSFVASGNVVKNAQEQGIFVVLIDTENALDKEWLEALDVDTSEDKLMKINATFIDDVAQIIHEFTDNYRKEFMELDESERPKVLFVIDSLGMLLTPSDLKQFESGELYKGNFGAKAKQLKALISNCVNLFADLDIGMLATNHTYQSTDMFDPTAKMSGGDQPIFACSIVVLMDKLKLKEDEDGNKVTDVKGIRSNIQVVKSRYAKPFEKVEVKIPYDTGMNPYSGLTEFFEKAGVLIKDGNKLRYEDLDGNSTKLFRKEYNKNTNGILDKIMLEFDEQVKKFKKPDEIILDGSDNEDEVLEEVEEPQE